MVTENWLAREGRIVVGLTAGASTPNNIVWQVIETVRQNENSPAEAADYLGLPLNDAGRQRALLFDYSTQAEPEHQCVYYTPFYNAIGPQGLKIWSETA